MISIPALIKSALEKASGIEDLDRTIFIQSLHAIDRLNHKAAAEIASKRFAKPKRWPEPEVERKLAREGTRVEFRCGLVGHKFGSGKIILLVHGWGGRGLQLGSLVGPLVKEGYSVVSLDGPGHGHSPGDWTSPTHFATFLKTVVHELGGIFGIIAHSFGAGSTVFALESNMDVEKAILIAAPNRYGKINERFCDAVGLSPEARHHFLNIVSYKVGFQIRESQLASYFSRVNQEVLLIHDRNDKELPYTESEELALSNAKSKLIITDGHGHRRILKADILVEKCVEFMRKK